MAHVLLAGASGFLGTHLRKALTTRGHTVTALVRRPAKGSGESTWDPYADTYDRSAVAAADVVINLAGAPTLGNPHSEKWARELRESRVTTTRVLARAVAEAGAERGRHPAFLAGNGISYYGDHRDLGDPVLDESAESRGDALLTSVTREWQDAADPAVEAGARVCILRTAPVMDKQAPPLKQLRLLFLTGLGGKLGDGRQHMAMVSLRDWVDSVVFLAEHDSASGPFNLCCAQTPTNAEFTEALAAQVHRPSFVAAPAFAIKAGAGRMAPELLGSLNVVPAALQASGYTIQDPDVTAVLRTALA
ncbi:TIGR01777 family oxidoreductase [Nocardioides flavescens]|uniref:TIGR01777 family protein n=1 Tax=Nocardioides flavescens TaxID=2691959 RepID=A0A6L7ESZ8_9ACTN|nr:TIGR01777 family protein [Nocardioides flavescens]